MEGLRYEINTKLEKKDYKKFLYIATFLRRPYTILLIIIISFFGGIMATWDGGMAAKELVIFYWIFMFIISMVTLMWNVERKNKRKSKEGGEVFSRNILYFYDDKIAITDGQLEKPLALTYNQIYEVLESKNYYIFYFSKTMASLIRKEDMAANTKDFSDFISFKLGNRYRKTLIG